MDPQVIKVLPGLVKAYLGLTVRSTTLRNSTREKVDSQPPVPPSAEATNLASQLEDLSRIQGGRPTEDERDGVLRSSLVAGTDPIATTLARAIWCLRRESDIREQLRDQLAGRLFSGPQSDSTPLLRNVIKETLRCYSPFGHALPRVVPAGGMLIGEYFIPAGVSHRSVPFQGGH